MKYFVVSFVFLLTACASGLNGVQEAQYKEWDRSYTLLESKSPGTGVALGFLPGGGSFYTGEYLNGTLNLLLWPVSIFWDPINGSNGAKQINFEETMAFLKKQKNDAMLELEEKFETGIITKETYVKEKYKIEKKYNYTYLKI